MNIINTFWQEIFKQSKHRKKDKRPALHHAAYHGDDSTLKSLLEKEPMNIINLQDEAGRTALHYAVRYGHISSVSLLLSKGANINICDRYHQSAFHEAVSAWNGDQTIFEKLLDDGADINLQDDNGETVLHLAVRYGNEPLIKKLGRMADLSLMNRRGETALCLVSRHEARKLLLDKSFRWATENEHDAVIEQLLKPGEVNIDTESKDSHGRTLLSYAAENRHEPIVKLLLEAKAEVDSKENHGRLCPSVNSQCQALVYTKLLLDRLVIFS
jgi:ankyrin repeat protein